MRLDGIDTALLDWGIGGLGIYRELARREPERRMLYISDAGMTPYGAMAPEALAARMLAIATWLRRHDIVRLVIACNAGSTVLPRIARRLALAGIEATGVIEHGLGMTVSSGARRIAVIGGGRTIRSGAYTRPLRREGIEARGRIAQPLSARIEAGDLDSASTRALVRRVLAPVRSYDALLLACTHYPALSEQFARVMPHAAILDPAGATVDAVVTAWPPMRARDGSDVVVTTGDPAQTRRAAMFAFAVDVHPLSWSPIDHP